MVLAVHLTFGAAIAELIAPQNPVLGFSVGFASHFLLDAVPHWDYPLNSRRANVADPLQVEFETSGRNFLIDLVKIVADGLIGLAVIFLIFRFAGVTISTLAFSGAVGALMPDFLQFAYFRWQWRFLKKLQIFHQACHSKLKIRQPFKGLIGQAAAVGLALILLIFK